MMPLSKKRMRDRKKADRASGLTMDDVKPQVRVLDNGIYKMVAKPDLDADGNVMPEVD